MSINAYNVYQRVVLSCDLMHIPSSIFIDGKEFQVGFDRCSPPSGDELKALSDEVQRRLSCLRALREEEERARDHAQRIALVIKEEERQLDRARAVLSVRAHGLPLVEREG